MMMLLMLTLSTSHSKVKVIGETSRSEEENVTKVIGATSSEGFLVLSVFRSLGLIHLLCF